jgi:hypothetical protein
MQTITESVVEVASSILVCRLHVIGEDTTLVPHVLSIVELHHHAKVRHQAPPGRSPAPPWCRRSVAIVAV